MANVVGDAYVMIHAITAGVDRDIKKGFNNTDKHGTDAGNRTGSAFRNGFQKNSGGGLFKNFLKESDAAKEKFSSLTRVGYTVAPLFAALAGTIGVLGSSLVSLASVIGAATLPAMATLASGMMALAQAAVTVKLAFAGVGKAISAGNKVGKKSASNAKALEKANKALERAQRSLGEAYEDAAKAETKAKLAVTDAENALHKARQQAIEDLQQLGFDSEDAAIAEQRAAIELEKARETLARVSDLPPNSRARKEAELAFASADLNYRRAIDANSDLKKVEAKNAAMGNFDKQVEGQENVVQAIRNEKEARDGLKEAVVQNERALTSATEARDDAQSAVDDLKNNKAAADEYADALAGLSIEAQRFVKFIVSLKEEFKALKAAAGEKLFPQLEIALQNLVDNLFPVLKPLLKETGDVLGRMAISFSKTVTSAENLKRLKSIWKTNNIFLEKLGFAANNLYEVFLILMDAAKPLITAFGDWLVKVTGAWKETLKLDEKTGKLSEKFSTAQGILKDLGTIFGNTFKGMGNIISANVGPGSGGQIFLDYFKNVTEKFKNLQTIDGKPLKEFFAGAAENGTKLLDLLGKIFGAFFKMADDPALGVFYDNIGKAVDIFASIDLSGAMVSISLFIIEFAKFVKLVTDSGSMQTFWDTLTLGLKKLNEFLAGETGQNILNLTAKILPLLAAFGLIAKIGGFAFKVVAGGVNALIKPFMLAGQAVGGLATFFGVSAGVVLGWVAVAAAVVAILVLAYQKSEMFREAIDLMVGALMGALKGAFEDIMGAIKDVFPTVQSLGDIFKKVGDFLSVTLVPILSFIMVRSIGVLSGAIQKVIYVIGGIIEAFKAVWNFVKGIFQLLTGNTEGAATSMKKSFEAAFNAIKFAIKSIVAPFTGIINAISDAWNNSIGKLSWTIPDWVPKIGGKTFSVPNLPRINLANFAKGGTVFPQDGGVLARVAEAGKPERIEPLDAEGLSVRDRAIIAELSGGGNGTTVNMVINPSAGMDERELAAIVSRQIAFQLRRGAA
jgi:hypothetical protein